MQPHNMGDINPLDLLATAAASLHTASVVAKPCAKDTSLSVGAEGENDDTEENEDANCASSMQSHGDNKSATDQILAVNSQDECHEAEVPKALNNDDVHKPVVRMRDATKLVLHDSETGKQLTVLRINTQQVLDHSYAYVGNAPQSDAPQVKVEGEGPLLNTTEAQGVKQDAHVCHGSGHVTDLNTEPAYKDDNTQPAEPLDAQSVSVVTETTVLPVTSQSDQTSDKKMVAGLNKNMVLRALLGGKTGSTHNVVNVQVSENTCDTGEQVQPLSDNVIDLPHVCVPSDSKDESSDAIHCAHTTEEVNGTLELESTDQTEPVCSDINVTNVKESSLDVQITPVQTESSPVQTETPLENKNGCSDENNSGSQEPKQVETSPTSQENNSTGNKIKSLQTSEGKSADDEGTVPVQTPLSVSISGLDNSSASDVQVLVSPALRGIQQTERSRLKSVVTHRDSIDSVVEKEGTIDAVQTSDYETDHCGLHSSSDESCDVNASSDSELGSCIVSPRITELDGEKSIEANFTVSEPIKYTSSAADKSSDHKTQTPTVHYVVKNANGNSKTVIPVQKYKYIIEDDIPPTKSTDQAEKPKVGNIETSGISNPISVNSNGDSKILLVNPPAVTLSGKTNVGTTSSTFITPSSSILKSTKLGPGTQILVARQVPVSLAATASTPTRTVLQLGPTTKILPQGILCRTNTNKTTASGALLLPRLPIAYSNVKASAATKTKGSDEIPSPIVSTSDGILNQAPPVQELSGTEEHTVKLNLPSPQSVSLGGVNEEMVTINLPKNLHGSSFAPIKNPGQKDSRESSRSSTPAAGLSSEAKLAGGVERWTINSSISGRQTPSLSTSVHEADSPSEKISVKIASSRIVEVSTPEPDVPKQNTTEYRTASIGTLGSISWNNVNSHSGTNTEESPAMKELLLRKKPLTCSALSEHLLGKDYKLNNGTVEEAPRLKRPYNRRKPKCPKVEISAFSEESEHLHPLIDHDYCAFTSFSAQVQSSIIATTELKFFKKYNKKKTAKPKEECELNKGSPSVKIEPELLVTNPEEQITEESNAALKKLPKKLRLKKLKKIKEKKRLIKEKKREKVYSPETVEKKGKNYVKITGSYQDDFVYFATKKTRGRPRKFQDGQLDHAQALPVAKQTSVGGLSVFDWYKDLSRADKSTKFGLSASRKVQNQSSSRQLQMPLHDTEVVDLVYEMEMESISESNSNAGLPDSRDPVYKPALHAGGDDMGLVSHSTTELGNIDEVFDTTVSSVKAESANTSANDSGIFSCVGSDTSTTLTASSEGLPSTNGPVPINTLLSSYVDDPSESGNNQLCDLDSINDSDLFSGDLNNMTDLLGEMASSGTGVQMSTSVVDSTGHMDVSSGCFGGMLDNGDGALKKDIDLSALERIKNGLVSGAESIAGSSVSGDSFGDYSTFSLGKNNLDRSELFPDMSQPEPTVMNDVIVPELTVVSMYWNDLPGLVINNKQYVRLVDIHKQVLPAKDTGILKKRCQMLELEIASCTEMQRDFLIRYANAAKSKSCVIIPKAAAETLIGFYVDPRPKVKTTPAGSRDSSPSSPAAQVLAAESPRSAEGEDDVDGDDAVDQVKDVSEPVTSRVSGKVRLAGKGKGLGKAKEPRRRTSRSPDDHPTDTKAKAAPRPAGPQETATAVMDSSSIKRSERLRHKKVPYAKLHEGNMSETLTNEPSEEKGALESKDIEPPNKTSTPETQTRSKPRFNLRVDLKRKKDSQRQTEDQPASKKRNSAINDNPLMQELTQLKNKARRRGLTSKERKKLFRLKEKVAQLRRQLRKSQRESTKKQVAVEKKVQTKMCNKVAESKCKTDNIQEKAKLPAEDQKQVKSDTVQKVLLHVLHRDNGRRKGQRGRMQEGLLHLHLYKTRYAACIECMGCKEKFSIYKFMRHLHHPSNPDELFTVTLPQQIELAALEPSQGQKENWQLFVTKRKQFELDPSKNCQHSKTNKETSKTVNDGDKISDKPGDDAHQTKTESLEVNVDDSVDVIQTKEPKVTQAVPPSDIASEPKAVPAKLPVKTETGVADDPGQTTKQVGGITPVLNKNSPTNGIIKCVKQEPEVEGAGGTRHSTRVRKRKQYHPIESYVFAQASQNGQPGGKVTKHEPSEGQGVVKHD